MKVKEIIPDGLDYKAVRVANHLKKKKKANPKASKAGTLSDFIDVFGGMSGHSAGNDTSGGSIV